MEADFKSRLRRAVKLDHQPSARPLGPGKTAAVLVPWATGPAGPRLLLTRRTDRVETHKGQIAFPGGMADPDDRGDLRTTALRETDEELGISPNRVEILGELPPVWTPTGILIHPVLGWLGDHFDSQGLKPSPEEIAEWFWADLRTLQDPSIYRSELWEYFGRKYEIHYFQVGAHEVWGATGAIVKNLLDRLALVS